MIEYFKTIDGYKAKMLIEGDEVVIDTKYYKGQVKRVLELLDLIPYSRYALEGQKSLEQWC
jgi:hypothetical protein